MITISSKAGQAMAKAGKALQDAELAVNAELQRVAADKSTDFSSEIHQRFQECRLAWQVACEAVTKELINGQHHEAEGD